MKVTRMLVLGSVASLLLTGCVTATGTEKAVDSGDLPAGVSINPEGGHALKRNDPVIGGSLRISLDAAIDTLDPLFMARSEWAIYHAIYDPLFVFDEEAKEVVGELAESLETDDDGKTWTMKLPSGVKFHDGTDFNSEAVAAHFARIASPESTSGAASDARNIVKMETPDSNTLLLTLNEPNPLLPSLLTTSVLTLVPSPTAVQKFGRQFGMHGVGTGAFMVESFLPGSDTRVVRNPNYRIDGLPYLDAIEFVTAVDNQSRLSAAIAGDIDLAQTNSALDFKRATEAGLLALPQATYTYFDIVLNMAKPPFDDVRFRKAVIQGIDLDALNQAVYGGLHDPMTGILPKSHPFYEDSDWPEFDPESAKELVDAWSRDTGLPAEFDIVTFAPPDLQKMSSIVQQMLADVGIAMNIQVGEAATMISESRSGNYSAQFRWITIPPETTQSLINNFHSESALNIGHAGDSQIDELLDDAKFLTDIDERREKYDEAQKRFAEWLPLVPTVRQVFGWYAGDRVGGFPGTIPALQTPDPKYLYIAN